MAVIPVVLVRVGALAVRMYCFLHQVGLWNPACQMPWFLVCVCVGRKYGTQVRSDGGDFDQEINGWEGVLFIFLRARLIPPVNHDFLGVMLFWETVDFNELMFLIGLFDWVYKSFILVIGTKIPDLKFLPRLDFCCQKSVLFAQSARSSSQLKGMQPTKPATLKLFSWTRL